MARKSEYKYTKMPWGKHKGKYVSELPDTYIKWWLKNINDLALAELFIAEAERRKLF